MDSLYLFYGEEQYLLEETVKKIKKTFNELIEGINFIKIDESNINQLIAVLETPCFGYEKKLVIVRNSGLFKKDIKKKSSYTTDVMEKLAGYIEQNINTIKQDNTLIFIEEVVEKNLLFKVIEEFGNIKKFEYENINSLIKRVKIVANAYNVDINDTNAKYLIECCGVSVQDVLNELRKLIEYAGENNSIQKDDIDKLTIKQIDSVIFDLTDMVAKKNVKNALEIFYNLIFQKEHVQKILVTLYNHFKKLYRVKIAQRYNENISDVLKLKPNQNFLVSKYKSQSNSFSEIELRNILKEFSDLDVKYKIGLIDINIGIESILCKYCSK